MLRAYSSLDIRGRDRKSRLRSPILNKRVQLKVGSPTLQFQLEFRTRDTLKLSGLPSDPCSSCALRLGSLGSCNKCHVLGVGVIYNPLHVQHGAPKARQINNGELQQAASEGSNLEIRVAAPSRLTIDFIWSTYTRHHAINLQGRFTDACSPTKGPTVSGLPPTSGTDLQLFFHWFPYLRQAAAFLYKSCDSAAYSRGQSDGGSAPCAIWPINTPPLWFCAPQSDVCVHYPLVNKGVKT